MPYNIHIYGDKDRALLTDESEVDAIMNWQSKQPHSQPFRRLEGSVETGLAYVLGYSVMHRKIVCLIRATRISNGKWWLTWDTGRVQLKDFQSEVRS